MKGMSFGPKQLKSPLAGGSGQAAGAPEPQFPPLKDCDGAVCPRGPWVPGLVHPHAVSSRITGGGQGLRADLLASLLSSATFVLKATCQDSLLKQSSPRKGLLFPRPMPSLFPGLWHKRAQAWRGNVSATWNYSAGMAKAADRRPWGLCSAMLPPLTTTLTCLPGQSSREGEIVSETDEQRQ